MQVRTQQNDTIDRLCWRHLGATAGYVEQTLELNPHLAQYGPVLPHGTLVELPDAKPGTTTKQNIVQLWD